MKALDLFCGLGGWSDGLAAEGFKVLGVEIEPHIAELYKHPVIIQDVRDLLGSDFKGYDLIVGSPPCRDFSQFTSLGHRWKVPPDPEGEGMSKVNAFLRIVKEAEPRFWLMENVVRLEKYLGEPPRCKARLSKTMIRGFWGNFPAFLIPKDASKGLIRHTQGKLRSWERAKIPEPVARALGKAVMSHITNNPRKEGSMDP